MHAEIPPADSSGNDDAVERMLRTLPVDSLPPAWRATILNALPPAAAPLPPAVSPTRFFTPKFVSLMAGIWGLTAAFHFTIPAPPLIPDGVQPPPASVYPPSFPSGAGSGDPWLARMRNPYLNHHP
ncbi:MAG: hypothetical protein V4726_23670 [Verrucomicrobiota bacterium]